MERTGIRDIILDLHSSTHEGIRMWSVVVTDGVNDGFEARNQSLALAAQELYRILLKVRNQFKESDTPHVRWYTEGIIQCLLLLIELRGGIQYDDVLIEESKRLEGLQ